MCGLPSSFCLHVSKSRISRKRKEIHSSQVIPMRKKKKSNGREWVTWTKIRELREADMSIFYWLIFESDMDTLNTQNIWLLVIVYVCMMTFKRWFRNNKTQNHINTLGQERKVQFNVQCHSSEETGICRKGI